VPGGEEEALVKSQLDNHRGIFTCDTAIVLSTEKKTLGVGLDGANVTSWLSRVDQSNMGGAGTQTNSWLNTAIFLQAMDILLTDSHQRALNHDFTAKLDPDAVFFPDRLIPHLQQHVGRPVIFMNCWVNNQPKLYGAMEIFSKEALKIYKAKEDQCKSLDWHTWGEDLYFQNCMGNLGVERVSDFELVMDYRCGSSSRNDRGGSCSDWTKATFHPYKDVGAYNQCWSESTGWYEDGNPGVDAWLAANTSNASDQTHEQSERNVDTDSEGLLTTAFRS
jgi:hypothetical protein